MMRLVPVIDILKGRAVQAVRGDRARYQPLDTPLCPSSAPLDALNAYLSLAPFKDIYIADLDGIEGRGANYATLKALAEAAPQTRLWVDAGVKAPEDAARLIGCGARMVVLGSESLPSAKRIDEINTALARILAKKNAALALSLDFKGEAFIGPPALLQKAALWPHDVIVMALSKVGANEGPDAERLGEIIARAKQRQVFAAGGVRNAADLAALKTQGVSGALIASALHDGRIGKTELARLAAHRQQGA